MEPSTERTRADPRVPSNQVQLNRLAPSVAVVALCDLLRCATGRKRRVISCSRAATYSHRESGASDAVQTMLDYIVNADDAGEPVVAVISARTC
jgi:hypothetical protein